MKILQSSVFRALCAVAIGVLLVSNPGKTVEWITILIGILFLLSGVISVAAWLSSRSHATDVDVYDAEGRLVSSRKQPFPVVGIGSVLLGVILTAMPGTFVTSLMYVLGAVIVLAAISQFMTLARLNRAFRVPIFMWICPSLVLLAGIVALVNPSGAATLPPLIIGWCLMLYGVSECINAYAVYSSNKRSRKAVEETAEEEASE